MTSALTALAALREGNARFAADRPDRQLLAARTHRSELVGGQAPSAVILGCADSRVPAEIVFDCGLGELFVVRVAGNVVASSQLGSVEFATRFFGTRLVVVMGHTNCGAVEALLDSLDDPDRVLSPGLHAIVDRIQPAVEGLLDTELRHDRKALLGAAVRANIRAAAGHLRSESEILSGLIRDDGLLIVGAEYSLETGLVDFFDGVP